MFKTDMRTKVALLIICFVALSVRLGLLWNTAGIPGSYGLTIWHGEVARNLVEGRGFVADKAYLNEMVVKINEANYLLDIEDITPPPNEQFDAVYQVAPGTPILLASTYWVFGEYRYIYLRILQALIDTFGCLIIFLLGRELFSKRVGLISAGIYALFLPIAFLSTMVMHDALMPFLVLTSLYLFVMGVRRNSIKHYVMSAFVAAVSAYFQPSTLFLPIVYGFGLFVYSVRKFGFWAKLLNTVKVVAIMMAIMVVIVVPWVVRNHQTTGIWSPSLRVVMWAGIWEGIGEFPDNPIGAKLADDYAILVAQKELGHDVEYGSVEFDAVFKPKVLNLIKEYPAWYVGAVLRRIPQTIFYVNGLGVEEHPPEGMSWRDWESEKITWANYAPALREGSLGSLISEHPYALFYWGLVVLFALMSPLMAFGGILAVGKEWRKIALILTMPFYFAIVHMATFVAGCGKSLLPGATALIVLSAVFVSFCYGGLKVKNEKKEAYR
jgi:4-amino-4-deoxy-L-arabinose transferase-like glycosyltransferase